MSQTSKEKLILLGLVLSFMFFFYGKILISPNSYLFSANGDGMKNYYTYAYFIKNNTDNIEHEGMNYPYNENFMYTDCHPLQASIFKKISKVAPAFADYSVGILNYLLMLSFLLTAYILYLIFKVLNINGYLSVISAFGILLMSPQIYRLLGHLALSYSFVIPLTIYFLILFNKQPKIKYLIYLGVFLILTFFTHAYLGMISALLVITYSGLILLLNLIKKKSLKHPFYLLLSSVIPVIIFYFFVKLTDTHLNRTTNPWGVYEHHANFSTVFLPNNGFLYNWLKPLTVSLKRPWEGWAYIGLIPVFSLIFYIVLLFKQKLFKDKNLVFINYLLLSSIIILCFSMLFPFRSFWEYLVEHFTIIKQFRAIGRFAWVFFFVTNILAVYLINYYLFQKKRKPIIIYTTLVLISAIYIFEGIGYHQKVSKEIVKSKNLLDINQTPVSFQENINQINVQNYQAIISLPFYYIGSDNYTVVSTSEAIKNAFLYSYHLKLPMVNAFLTRISICESKKIMQLLGKDFYPKKIKNDLKSDKPFLIISTKKDLTDAETDLINKSNVIIDNEDIQILEVTLKDLFKNTYYDEMLKFKNIKDSLYLKNNFLVSDTNLFFSYNNFDTLPDQYYEGQQKKYNILSEVNGNKLNNSSTYIARFWLNIQGKNCGQGTAGGMVFFTETIKDSSKWVFPIYTAKSSHQITGDWMLVEIPLKNIKKEATYKLIIKGDERSIKNYKIDDLLFYDSQLKIYKEMPNFLFKNNHKIAMPN